MSGHDQLCPHDSRHIPCQCDRLRQAREQERELLADMFRERAIIAENEGMAAETSGIATAFGVVAGIWRQAVEVSLYGHRTIEEGQR